MATLLGMATESLQGVLERIVYFNEENNYCIGELRVDKGANGGSGPTTIVGTMPGVQCGETLLLQGQWKQHREYGDQFAVERFESRLPASVYGIRKYLGSGLVKGIGKVYADKIVDKFGEDTLRIISEESGRLREVPGIGAGRAKKIKQSWEEAHHERELVMFLQTYGVSISQCKRLIRMYGGQAKQVLQNEPYRVAREIDGIGFKTADKIAINLGYANDGPQRIDAGILYTLRTLEDEGHTGFPIDALEQKAVELLGAAPPIIAGRIRELLQQKELVSEQGTSLVQVPMMRQAERKIAQHIEQLNQSPSNWPAIVVDKAVQWAQERAGFAFAQEQAAAVKACLEHKVVIITGGPGTGKTTILRAVVDILRAKKIKMQLGSPTGRAAQRLSQSARMNAQTLHRMLKFDPMAGGFQANEDKPLSGQCFIIDEASMLDTRLASVLFRALPARAHIILVGDIDQLPSVGAGNVLRDLIESGQCKVVKLQKIFRQGKDSGIVTTAHAVLAGVPSPPNIVERLVQMNPELDLQMCSVPQGEHCIEALVRLCSEDLPKRFGLDPIKDVQVLAPMHKGICGVGNINQRLQEALNSNTSGVRFGNQFFKVGDKIIQMRNNYDKNLFNGDLGIVTRINLEAGTIAARFDSGEIDYERPELAELSLAYAFSIHKSQGSEFPCVVMPLLKAHFMLLQRNLLYTGITRARNKVILLGDPAAYAMAVRNQDTSRRFTGLLQQCIG